MAPSAGTSAEGVPPFHVHRGHLFEGFEVVERDQSQPVLVARCSCAVVLDVAEARFARCPDCLGSAAVCARCDGSGLVVDHAALEWRAPPR